MSKLPIIRVISILATLIMAIQSLIGQAQVNAAAPPDVTITPPNNINPGASITFQITLQDTPTGAYLFTWGKGGSALGQNPCQSPSTSPYNEIIPAGTINTAGVYWAKVYRGCPPAAITFLPNAISFIVGDSAGDTPMTPPDERSTFMCRGNQECVQCILSGNWWTVVGCIPTGQGGFVQTIVNLITGIAGGISFLIMLKGAALMMTSQGDPHQVEAGKSSMTKGAAGLLIVIFATVILRIMASDILRLPGFGQ